MALPPSYSMKERYDWATKLIVDLFDAGPDPEESHAVWTLITPVKWKQFGKKNTTWLTGNWEEKQNVKISNSLH